ncbi:MAG TPA: MFS transporter [Longimicrobium sp.]|jgi:MFS family permease|nr:MFS transporter [Longimicrobium sp.]
MTDDTRAAPPTKGSLLRGNVLWLSVVSFMNDTASEMIYPLLPIFLTGVLGAGAGFLGVIEGVAEASSSLLKLASGVFADRSGRRKPLVAWGYGVAAVARPLIAVATAPWQVLAIRFSERLGKGLRTAPRDAMLTESVPVEVRGAAFGIHRAADHAGAVAGPLLASALLLLMPGRMREVFAFALIPGLLTLAVVLLKVRDPRGTAVPARPVEEKRAALPPFSALGRVFPRYLGVLVLFALGNSSDAFLLLRARDLGVAVALIPLLWAALHVSKMIWSVIGGRLSDRTGPRRTIVAGWLVYAAVYGGFAVASAEWHAWALFLVYGLFFGLTEAPEKSLVAAFAPAELRGSAFGWYHAVIGVSALFSSILFGVLWQSFGAATAFLTGAALALAAAVLLPLVVPARETATG